MAETFNSDLIERLREKSQELHAIELPGAARLLREAIEALSQGSEGSPSATEITKRYAAYVSPEVHAAMTAERDKYRTDYYEVCSRLSKQVEQMDRLYEREALHTESSGMLARERDDWKKKYERTESARLGLIEMLEASETYARDVTEAATKLANEAEGIAEMARDCIGNTNVAVLLQRVRLARAALAKNPAEPTVEDMLIERDHQMADAVLAVDSTRGDSWTGWACSSCHACGSVPPGQPVPTACFNCRAGFVTGDRSA